MILELDCGNTRVKWRIKNHQGIQLAGFFPTEQAFIDDIKEMSSCRPTRVLVSSVLGDQLSKKIIGWSLNTFGLNPEFAISETYSHGISNGYQQPERLGVDRWLGILAAKTLTQNAYIVVDSGSAITVDVVTAAGEHLGGYIAPGLSLMCDALSRNTVAIKLAQIGYPESAFPGRNTVAAIKSAEMAMIKGLVEHAIDVLKNYQTQAPDIFITGGDGIWLSSEFIGSTYIEDLVLDGLSIALNSSSEEIV